MVHFLPAMITAWGKKYQQFFQKWKLFDENNELAVQESAPLVILLICEFERQNCQHLRGQIIIIPAPLWTLSGVYTIFSSTYFPAFAITSLLWCKIISKRNPWLVFAQICLLPHPSGPIESLILAGVVRKWKGGHRPQRPPSLDPCQPHTSALIWALFEPEGRVAVIPRGWSLLIRAERSVFTRPSFDSGQLPRLK